MAFFLKGNCCMEANPMYSPLQYQAQPQLQYVGVGMRFLALLIDSILVGVIGGILGIIFRSSLSTAGEVTLTSAIGSILVILYYVGLEATQGATLGKMMLGLRIVKVDGTPIGWSESIIRNLLRIIDGLFGYLVGAILIWTSPQRQRLGDRLAKTVVIRRQS
jgi:uncharacterized RDD family membrane protein YckC